jgi:DNA-binding response OmpR family regulator
MSKKILIVEDDTFLKSLATTKLTKEGYEVLPAGSVEELDKILELQTPDIILLDLLLPGTDGFGILKKIRENLKLTETPVIIFSNLSDEKDIAQAKALGANHFMIKSNFTLDEIVTKVKELLD